MHLCTCRLNIYSSSPDVLKKVACGQQGRICITAGVRQRQVDTDFVGFHKSESKVELNAMIGSELSFIFKYVIIVS